jgi:hypothetical protein
MMMIIIGCCAACLCVNRCLNLFDCSATGKLAVCAETKVLSEIYCNLFVLLCKSGPRFKIVSTLINNDGCENHVGTLISSALSEVSILRIAPTNKLLAFWP